MEPAGPTCKLVWKFTNQRETAPGSAHTMSIERRSGRKLRVEELEPRLAPANDLFAVPAADSPGTPVELRFEWGAGGAAFKNEIGVYALDDADGRVNGLLPSDPGYAGQALLRAQVVFARGAGIGAKNALSFDGGQLLGLYLVSNNTTQAALAGGAPVFFTFDAANGDRVDHAQTRNRGDGGTDFRFEDLPGGGDLDYNDAVISVTRTYAVPTPGQLGQTVQANFVQVARDATYRNEVGLFRVDARDGSVGDVKPGDPGYVRAALASGTRQIIFSDTTLAGVTSRTLTLEAGVQYAFYIVTEGTADELLARNEANAFGGGPLAYFSFSDASADRTEHLDWRSSNEFGVEDLFGAGDADFNDMVIRFGFGEPQGEPTEPPPPPPPPPPADTTPPTGAFQLTSDTGTSSTDRITSNPQIVATITDNASAITRLRAGFDSATTANFVDVLPNLTANGTLTFTTALITQVNRGNPLPNGAHTLFVDAADAAGNSDLLQFAFTLDTVAPVRPLFDLAAASDSGPDGDLRTDASQVTLSGTSEAGATLELLRTTVPGAPGSGTVLARTTAAANGTFSFANVGLNVGPNSFVVRAVDVAGNVGPTLAQTFTRNTGPTVANPIGPQTATAGGPDLTFNLANTFADAERVARFTTAFPTGQTGNIDVHLFATQTPTTVNNFVAYATNADPTRNYDGSVFHRLAPGFVLQGGGFKFNDAGTTTATAFPEIVESAAIVNEPGVSNTRGTIAMAKVGNNPNSATSEFFFNLADNSGNLDSQNGGFTVFGQVMNGTQQTVDAISGLATFEGAGIPGAPPFPVRPGANTTNFPANINAGDVALVNTVRELTAAERMTFSVVGNTNAAAATASVSGSTLTIDPLAAGTTTITVRATDLDGSVTDTQIVVVVS
jgi:cyclophilin family peptidyl-prolyl cis-trans isomerase